jgi:hypothetical protein
VVDDQQLVRSGFASLLDAEDDLDVVGEAAELLRAIRVVADGEALLSPKITRAPHLGVRHPHPRRPPHPQLGPADPSGTRGSDAHRIGVVQRRDRQPSLHEPSTAKTHAARAMTKVGARDRAQLVVFAYEAGLVRPGIAQ